MCEAHFSRYAGMRGGGCGRLRAWEVKRAEQQAPRTAQAQTPRSTTGAEQLWGPTPHGRQRGVVSTVWQKEGGGDGAGAGTHDWDTPPSTGQRPQRVSWTPGQTATRFFARAVCSQPHTTHKHTAGRRNREALGEDPGARRAAHPPNPTQRAHTQRSATAAGWPWLARRARGHTYAASGLRLKMTCSMR